MAVKVSSGAGTDEPAPMRPKVEMHKSGTSGQGVTELKSVEN
eukprot:CAMPEP_0195056038 /NCGR_PEP_ID=MMETSP0448-20130528/4588_1 /TAXON_ID=66468 /ORGANISM="Heterocapsa triquestra, Strain CCMP 448" /LENGTH=41 /DNA_ID= /DNA_START= /DNA_END= /DNA_ORIENTATION=